jgi:hypothetical protein
MNPLTSYLPCVAICGGIGQQAEMRDLILGSLADTSIDVIQTDSCVHDFIESLIVVATPIATLSSDLYRFVRSRSPGIFCNWAYRELIAEYMRDQTKQFVVIGFECPDEGVIFSSISGCPLLQLDLDVPKEIVLKRIIQAFADIYRVQ